METNEAESLLNYYNSELTWLRRMARTFSRRYPRVAARLELSADSCADPHTERLLESFALLTGRLQRRMDQEFPEITSALLGVLYPHLTAPTPSMTIAKFDVDPDLGKITTGYEVPAKTALFAQTSDGFTCRFRSCYPVTLWPLEVRSAAFESPAQFEFLNTSRVASVLRIGIHAMAPMEDLKALRKLRFFIQGEPATVNTIYELLFARSPRIALLPKGASTPFYLPENSLSPVGFLPEDEVIPYPPQALPAYRIIQEYFLFPEKYHFFDLLNLNAGLTGDGFDILILLDQAAPNRMALDSRTFSLGCTPIINLFRRTTEPIRLDQRSLEYTLDPDVKRPRTTEIHSILSVSASSNPVDETAHLQPFYSYRHSVTGEPPRAFWHARRVPSVRDNLPGTDMLLSFLDLDFRVTRPPDQTVFANVECTNRDFATAIPDGAMLQIESAAPLSRISCIGRPTPPVYPPLGGATIWNLISNLSLNYLSLSSETESLDALRQMLRLYSFSSQTSSFQELQGIRSMSTRRVLRRVGSEPWKGFCQGTEISLRFDESFYVGSSAFLLGSVLCNFFALYCAVNSFAQLVIYSDQREGEWKRWPPQAGLQALI